MNQVKIRDVLNKYKSRVIDTYGDPNSHLKLICVAAIHGNEQAGVLALKQVINRLRENKITIKGELIALLGNQQAVQQNTRFIDHDLNRVWSDRHIDEARNGATYSEAKELIELYDIIETYIDAGKDVVLFDLHTMSSDSFPFICYYNTNNNLQLAYYYPVPNILGLEDFIPTTMIIYYSQKGIPAICFEGGQHTLSTSVLNIEAAAWQMLFILNMVDYHNIEKPEQFYKRLDRITSHLPDLVRVKHRHKVETDSQFKMEAGFDNLHKVKKGELLATDKDGDIRSEISGRIILPLYQGQGEDGFYLGISISKIRLKWYLIWSKIKYRLKNLF